LKFLQKQRERKHGIDVYSLAIGESLETQANSANKSVDVSILFSNFKLDQGI